MNPYQSLTFNYALPGGTLNNQQRRVYEENGFVVIENLVDSNILEQCRQRFVDICEGRVKSNAMLMKEIVHLRSDKRGEYIINKIQDLTDDDVFMKYFKNEKLLDAVTNFTGPDIVSVHTMFINKPPLSARHPPHQDYFFNPFENPNQNIAVWTAVDDVDEENGCLFFIPGSHKQEKIIPHALPEDKVNIGFLGVQEEDKLAPESKRVYLKIKAGDTVFIHPLVVHGSRPNISTHYRKCISGIYKSSSSNFLEDISSGSDHVVSLRNKEYLRKGLRQEAYKAYFNNVCKVVRDHRSHI